jgi:hypothetical protein
MIFVWRDHGPDPISFDSETKLDFGIWGHGFNIVLGFVLVYCVFSGPFMVGGLRGFR